MLAIKVAAFLEDFESEVDHIYLTIDIFVTLGSFVALGLPLEAFSGAVDLCG